MDVALYVGVESLKIATNGFIKKQAIFGPIIVMLFHC